MKRRTASFWAHDRDDRGLRRGQRERLDGEFLFAAEAQRSAAGSQDLQRRAGAQEPADEVEPLQDVLAVIQQQETGGDEERRVPLQQA